MHSTGDTIVTAIAVIGFYVVVFSVFYLQYKKGPMRAPMRKLSSKPPEWVEKTTTTTTTFNEKLPEKAIQKPKSPPDLRLVGGSKIKRT